mgnify:CR=1 FL=1
MNHKLKTNQLQTTRSPYALLGGGIPAREDQLSRKTSFIKFQKLILCDLDEQNI